MNEPLKENDSNKATTVNGTVFPDGGWPSTITAFSLLAICIGVVLASAGLLLLVINTCRGFDSLLGPSEVCCIY